MGRFIVADALRAIGITVEVHHDHFEQAAKDSEWLPVVGKRGWIVLTKDRTIKSNQLEIQSLIEADVACFNLVSADMTGPQMAQAFVAAIPHAIRLFEKIDRPFVANVTRSGCVKLLYRRSELVDRLP